MEYDKVAKRICRQHGLKLYVKKNLKAENRAKATVEDRIFMRSFPLAFMFEGQAMCFSPEIWVGRKPASNLEIWMVLHEVGHHKADPFVGVKPAMFTTMISECVAWNFALDNYSEYGLRLGPRVKQYIRECLLTYRYCFRDYYDDELPSQYHTLMALLNNR